MASLLAKLVCCLINKTWFLFQQNVCTRFIRSWRNPCNSVAELSPVKGYCDHVRGWIIGLFPLPLIRCIFIDWTITSKHLQTFLWLYAPASIFILCILEKGLTPMMFILNICLLVYLTLFSITTSGVNTLLRTSLSCCIKQ